MAFEKRLIETLIQNYRTKIPNGHKVPHPCNPTSDKWVAVGHMLPGGRGPRNPFGEDFAAHGQVSINCFENNVLSRNQIGLHCW